MTGKQEHDIAQMMADMQKKIDDRFDAMDQKLDPMYEVFTAGRLSGRIAKWSIGVIVAILTIIKLIQEIRK